jgi:hypothetical protein
MRVLRLAYLALSRLPPFQRLACLALLLQSTGSLIIIVIFSVVQSAGVDIHPFEMGSVASLFDDVYRINPSATFAKTRFDGLFLPLAIIYGVSLPCLLVSIVRNLPAVLKDLRRNARILGATAFWLLGLWLELFVRVPSSHKDLQQNIIDGGVIGYIILFVTIPIALAISAAGLPFPKNRHGSSVGLIDAQATS